MKILSVIGRIFQTAVRCSALPGAVYAEQDDECNTKTLIMAVTRIASESRPGLPRSGRTDWISEALRWNHFHNTGSLDCCVLVVVVHAAAVWHGPP